MSAIEDIHLFEIYGVYSKEVSISGVLQYTSTLAFGNALDVLDLFRKHDCLFEENEHGWLVVYPESTKREEIFPRGHDTHSQIMLPDGYVFEEQYVSMSGTSILRYPVEMTNREEDEYQTPQY